MKEEITEEETIVNLAEGIKDEAVEQTNIEDDNPGKSEEEEKVDLTLIDCKLETKEDPIVSSTDVETFTLPCDQCDFLATASTELKYHKEMQHKRLKRPAPKEGGAHTSQAQGKPPKTSKRDSSLPPRVENFAINLLRAGMHLTEIKSTVEAAYPGFCLYRYQLYPLVRRVKDFITAKDVREKAKAGNLGNDENRESVIEGKGTFHEGMVYPCDFCDFVTTKSINLKRHERRKHRDVRFPCDQCDFKAKKLGYLTVHKKSKHGGLRYPCDQCNHVSTRLWGLRKHKETKHEEKKFSCDQCEYVTTLDKHLRTHVRSKHQGLLLICDQCGFRTAYVGNLKKHKESKHGEGRYECDLCDFSAKTARSLKRHKEKNHLVGNSVIVDQNDKKI